VYLRVLPFFSSFGALFVFFLSLLGYGNISTGHNQEVVNKVVGEILGKESPETQLINFRSESQKGFKSLNKEFEVLVKDSIDKDRTCKKVVTGNDGEKSLEQIKGEGNISRTNKELKIKDYPTFMARNFLSMLCQSRKSSSKFKEVHPFQRAVLNPNNKKKGNNDLGEVSGPDALAAKNFRDPIDNFPELSKLSLNENGIHNLIYGQALVYSLVIRESNSQILMLDPKKLNKFLKGFDRDAAFQQKIGLCHQSADSMGPETLNPFALALLNQYIKKVKYLLNDTRSKSVQRFNDFCGTSHFEEIYNQKKQDPRKALQAILFSTVEYKKNSSKKKELLTCDEILDDGVIGFKAGNVHSCYMALQEFCPNYSVAHANLVVRGNCRNNGPLQDVRKGVRPACHTLFYNIYQRFLRGDDLCELAEDFSMH